MFSRKSSHVAKLLKLPVAGAGFLFHSGDLLGEPLPEPAGSVPLQLLREVPWKSSWVLRCSSTCPILPQSVLQMSSRALDTDLPSWFAFLVMKHCLKRVEIETMKIIWKSIYVTTGPHVNNMLCNIVEVVTLVNPLKSNPDKQPRLWYCARFFSTQSC